MSMTTTLQPALFDDELVPQIFPDDSPRVRRSDPITSHLAADSISKSGRRDSQQHVLIDLTLYGRSAAWQIAERAELRNQRWSPSRLRTALKELEEQGRVVRFSKSGVNPGGYSVDEFEVAS